MLGLRRKARADGLSVADAFGLVFGRPPTPPEVALVHEKIDWHAEKDDLARLKCLVGRLDQLRMGGMLSIRFSRDDLDLHELDGFKILLHRADGAVGDAVRATGGYERHVEAFIREHVKSGMIAVDAGANIGYYTLLMSSLVGERGRVAAVEPGSENCRLIYLSMLANDFNNIDVHAFALADKFRSVFFSHVVGGNGMIATDVLSHVASPTCTVVPCAPLDAVIDGRVDFIKADIEGAEFLALTGAERILRRYRPIVVAEVSRAMSVHVSGVEPEQILRWMADRGYRARQISGYAEPPRDIPDIDLYFSGWNDERIEDIAFIPVEREMG